MLYRKATRWSGESKGFAQPLHSVSKASVLATTVFKRPGQSTTSARGPVRVTSPSQDSTSPHSSMDGSGNTEASPKLAGQILNNSELYVRNISYKDQYAFLMVFLLTLTHLHPDTEKTKLTCGALHKWWSDLDTKARKAVKFVCQFIKSNDDIIHLCSGIGVSPKGSELACAIGEKISAQKYSFKGIKNVIMDLCPTQRNPTAKR
jgi:hypothetical protein